MHAQNMETLTTFAGVSEPLRRQPRLQVDYGLPPDLRGLHGLQIDNVEHRPAGGIGVIHNNVVRLQVHQPKARRVPRRYDLEPGQPIAT
jgi:hypothetical protein